MTPSSELPVSRIKVRIPYRRRELITRTRLIDALYDQLEKRLLLIVAPAGYGKTSLLVDLAEQSELPVCWLSLDALDQEPQRFLRYLIAALNERFPKFGRDSLAALESMTSIEQDEERLLVTITNEINAQINEHFILILDDYHLVGNIPFINHVISRFLQLTGEQVHLILATRNLPNLPDTPLMIARNQVGGLSFEELSFYPEEIQQLFQQNNGILLSPQDAQTLVKETEGWIAAIHLTNGHPGTLPQMHPLESTRELFDFFSKEVLLRQPEDVRRFMLMTSVFDTFDAALCEKVLEPLMEGRRFDWPVLFETVRTGSLFSVPLDNEGRWMRYHHLFQHFLRSQLQYKQPALAWHIQQNLARAYEEQQSWEEALEIYARLEDYENEARLLNQASRAFILGGRIFTLANWLDRLPADVVLSHPALVSLMGMIHASRGDDRQALELLDLAESKLQVGNYTIDWATALVRRAETCRQLGYYDRALQDVEKILQLSQSSSDPDMQYTYVEGLRLKGLLLFAVGHMSEAQKWLQEALQTCRSMGIENFIPILQTELGVVHRRLGEPEITAQYYASALKAWENAGHTGWKARLLNNLGLLYHMTGRLEESFPLLQEALKTSERSGYVRIQTNVLISLGDLLTDLLDFDSAYLHYDNALTLASNLGYSLHIFYASLGLARLQRLKGNHLLAIEELRKTELSQVNLGNFERAMLNLELGCCWLHADKLDLCVDSLRESVALFLQSGNQMEQAIAQLWLEAALSIKSPRKVNSDKFKELLPPQRDWQKLTPQMIHAGRVARLLKKKSSPLLKDSLLQLFFEQAERIRESLSAVHKNLTSSDQSPQTVSPRLEITSFGEVQVRHNQRPISLSDWQTREARDLFFFLLQSRPLTKEQVALVFWPDISPARLKVRFKINIYRIRQAIGQDTIVFENDRYQFNRSISFSWDREELDRLNEKLQQSTVPSEKRRLLEQAIELVKGDYLADLDAEWVIPDRLRYQDFYRQAMLELAALYLQDGRPRECLNAAKQVLLSDTLMEEAHRLIIQAYASLHDPVNMTLQYRQYQQALEDELGIQPSSEISTLYEQLMAEI
ncbi:MAG TPA: tetratricopeptide repeat protein [Anaerolineales bacterium]|nr:tetratricopeptide repeat protein [Anaerolineales bacterium]